MHDAVDLVGQAVESSRLETEPRLGDVADDDLEVVAGELVEALLERGIVALERRGQAAGGRVVIGGPHQADDLPADGRQPLQPFQAQEAAEEAGRARQQHRPRLAGGSPWGTLASVSASMKRAMSRSLGVSSTGALAVDPGERRQLGCASLLASAASIGPGPLLRVPGRAEDRVDRQLHAEDVREQRRERGRTEGVAAEVDEAERLGRRRRPRRPSVASSALPTFSSTLTSLSGPAAR